MRVLFTGLGSIGRRHLRLLREREELFDIHAYRSGASGRSAPVGVTEHDVLEDALATAPDVAFVTNPTALHVETALACARADCDLFVEKPLSHSMEGIDELIRESEERDLITYVGCQLRYHPVVERVKELVDEGMIGEVYSFRAYSGSYLPDWRPGQDYRESYSADPDLGGGVVLDLIHEIDYAHWIFGEAVDVRSWCGRVSDLEIQTEDLAEIVVETEMGAVGEIHLDYYRPEARRTLEVIGGSGVIEADLLMGTINRHDGERSHLDEFGFERDDLFRKQLDAFLSNVREDRPCENDLHEGKRVLSTALGVKGD